MRVFVASGIFHPESGGPATYLYHFLPELLSKGHDVTALAYGTQSGLENYPYPITRIPRRFHLLRMWDYYQAARNLWRGHDVAYLHTLGLPLPRSVHPRVLKIVGDKAWERGMNRGWLPPTRDIDDFQGHFELSLAQINKWARSWQVRRADHVIVPSNYLKNMVMGWGVPAERITVIYNALRETENPTISQKEARRRLGLPPDVPLLFTAARLTSWKGVDFTLNAIKPLDDFHFVVAGDGPQRPILEEMVVRFDMMHRVTFTGLIPREQVATYLRAADYAVLYSGYEGLPHFLLESLQMGTPVIASLKGGNPEVIEHNINGFLVDYPYVPALSNAIRRAFLPGRRAQLAANTSTGLDRFRWETMVEQTIRVLEETARRY